MTIQEKLLLFDEDYLRLEIPGGWERYRKSTARVSIRGDGLELGWALFSIMVETGSQHFDIPLNITQVGIRAISYTLWIESLGENHCTLGLPMLIEKGMEATIHLDIYFYRL